MSAQDLGDSKRTRKVSLNNLARAGTGTRSGAGVIPAAAAVVPVQQENFSMFGLIIGTRIGIYWDGDNVFYRVSGSLNIHLCPPPPWGHHLRLEV